MYRQK